VNGWEDEVQKDATKIAKYQKLHATSRHRSDWRKKTGETMARNGKKSQMKNME